MKIFIFEGYKEAQTDFAQTAPTDEVTSVIDAYKALVNKNQVQGNERNIDYWRKQGWDNFKKFVVTKQSQPTQTQVKRNKIVGKSITLQENNEWLIVIPLDKDASCFHGKDTDWCTTKQHQGHFEQYFYDKDVTLIYCLQKETRNKWAIAFHERVSQIELFDKEDNSINKETFYFQTGLSPIKLINLTKKQHTSTIQNSKDNYRNAITQLEEIFKKNRIIQRNEEIEKLLMLTKNINFINRYVTSIAEFCKKVRYPKELTIPLLHEYPEDIQHILNPTEYEQQIAVDKSIFNIRYIENPTDKVCKIAIDKNCNAIGYISPTHSNYENLCLFAIKTDSYAINEIPRNRITYEMSKLAVENNGRLLSAVPPNINDYRLCEIAVKNDAKALSYVPLELLDYKLCMTAVKNNGISLYYVPDELKDYNLIKHAAMKDVDALNYINPDDLSKEELRTLWMELLKKDGNVLYYIPGEEQTYEMCEIAVKQNPKAFLHISELVPNYGELISQAKKALQRNKNA